MGNVMRQALLLGALMLVACGPDARRAEENYQRFMAESNALLAPAMPRGWHYVVRPDRIRGGVDRLASLPNEDSVPRDQSLILSIQQIRDEPVTIAFRGQGIMLGCQTVCGIAYRAGDKTGSWTAEQTYDGRHVALNWPEDALPIIQQADELIIEIDSDIGGQHTFKVAGLTWPPSAAGESR